ncbi:MAG: hypothetical protein M1835_002196, partial [Candelina submexicana]
MYSTTLIGALMLFIGGTQALVIPKEPLIHRPIEDDGDGALTPPTPYGPYGVGESPPILPKRSAPNARWNKHNPGGSGGPVEEVPASELAPLTLYGLNGGPPQVRERSAHKDSSPPPGKPSVEEQAAPSLGLPVNGDPSVQQRSPNNHDFPLNTKFSLKPSVVETKGDILSLPERYRRDNDPLTVGRRSELEISASDLEDDQDVEPTDSFAT